MSRYLAVALPDYGHLLPMLAVANELRQRGHTLAVVTVADRVDVVRSWGCDPLVLAPEVLPEGWLQTVDAGRAVLSGHALNRFSLEVFTEAVLGAVLADLPRIVEEFAPDTLLLDPYCYGAASVAAAAGVDAVGVERGACHLRGDPVDHMIEEGGIAQRQQPLVRIRKQLRHLATSHI